ncbi:competence type IV pilus minor pilin ComGD [Fictibacillus fluitans]|uniref:Competence type IV pilus minor pilin ComGD n=1 Tax=Fictibacillus fluitans TaxID=3058422 RepID=A0ABT8HX68_9BACL|nr:competence type IV pilus minor pilin ComGD [Fictibacillus sp. NE201]MDN4525304.1 competence type IV pilus minor pilin ComGD [Fictibacillus sp. NE201]
MKREVDVNGYSLIELLIVLSISSILLGVTAVSLQSFYKSREVHFFLDQLKKDLYYTQRQAVMQQKVVFLHIDPGQHKYMIGSGLSIYKEIKYADQVLVESFTMTMKINYTKNGTISSSGTLLIKTEAGKYRLVFLLGKGRFYVEKM